MSPMKTYLPPCAVHACSIARSVASCFHHVDTHTSFAPCTESSRLRYATAKAETDDGGTLSPSSMTTADCELIVCVYDGICQVFADGSFSISEKFSGVSGTCKVAAAR